MNDLKREWNRAVLGTVHGEGVQAELGNDAGVIYFVDENGTTHGGTVWARFVDEDGTVTEVAVNNSALPATYGLPVLLVERDRGLTAIIDSFGYRMQSFTNNGGWLPLQQHWFTHRRLGTDPRFVEGLAFEPGLVRPSSPVAMTVYVESGWYKYNGSSKVWAGGDSGSISAYVPSTNTGAKHFVIVALDRANNTLVIVDGANYGNIYAATLTLADIAAVSMDSAYYPLAAIELYYGQTTITATDIKFDLRRWLGDGGGVGDFALDVDNILVDANGTILVDAAGNVMVGA